MRLYLKFIRKAEILEVGGVGIDLEENATWEDAVEKAKSGQFAEFVVYDRTYLDEDWEFGEFDDPDDDGDDDGEPMVAKGDDDDKAA